MSHTHTPTCIRWHCTFTLVQSSDLIFVKKCHCGQRWVYEIFWGHANLRPCQWHSMTFRHPIKAWSNWHCSVTDWAPVWSCPPTLAMPFWFMIFTDKQAEKWPLRASVESWFDGPKRQWSKTGWCTCMIIPPQCTCFPETVNTGWLPETRVWSPMLTLDSL